MRTATIKEIKTALDESSHINLITYCLRLAKLKKENKELLTYMLFEEFNEEGYVTGVMQIIDESFESLNTKNLYIAKKNIRKIIRTAGRYIKYSDDDTTGITIWIHVCKKISESGLNINSSIALANIYNNLIKKITKSVSELHEDLQYDYNKELESLKL